MADAGTYLEPTWGAICSTYDIGTKVMVTSSLRATVSALACLIVTAVAISGPSSLEAAVVQSKPPAVAKSAIPSLHLSASQRQNVQQVLRSKDTEVSFALKSAKPAASFVPTVGATVPASLKLHPVPRPLVYQVPQLKRYTYVKLKHELLIVNPFSRKIADMFPES